MGWSNVSWEWEASAPSLADNLRAMRSEGAPKALTPAQVEEFDRSGVLLPLRAISETEAAAVRARVEQAEVAAQQGGNGLFTNAHCTHDWFYELATCDSVVDVVEDLLGPNIMIWKSQLWIKESKSGSFVGWVRGCLLVYATAPASQPPACCLPLLSQTAAPLSRPAGNRDKYPPRCALPLADLPVTVLHSPPCTHYPALLCCSIKMLVTGGSRPSIASTSGSH